MYTNFSVKIAQKTTENMTPNYSENSYKKNNGTIITNTTITNKITISEQ